MSEPLEREDITEINYALLARLREMTTRQMGTKHARKLDRLFVEELKSCPSWPALFKEWTEMYGTRREDRVNSDE